MKNLIAQYLFLNLPSPSKHQIDKSWTLSLYHFLVKCKLYFANCKEYLTKYFYKDQDNFTHLTKFGKVYDQNIKLKSIKDNYLYNFNDYSYDQVFKFTVTENFINNNNFEVIVLSFNHYINFLNHLYNEYNLFI
uniref:Uncharacterized protein n=1 Tax=Inonotus obliquus TaxID=167356 RepID=A0A5A4UBI7_9AGAM|nr:hypothetical protein [Inonotus obliquus]BBN21298.1 hypothetical protein [Inonotus obliquus]